MPARLTFHEELRELGDSLLAMGDIVGAAVETAVSSLVSGDRERAQDLVDGDDRVNGLQAQITRDTLKLLATQQPMATDLREVLAVFSIAADLERMADHAKGICKIALRLDGRPTGHSGDHLSQMGSLVRELLAKAFDAFNARDEMAAQTVARRDDEVDALYEVIYDEIVASMVADRGGVKSTDRLLWAAKSLERCGDHITNICEWIVFLSTGNVVELNP